MADFVSPSKSPSLKRFRDSGLDWRVGNTFSSRRFSEDPAHIEFTEPLRQLQKDEDNDEEDDLEETVLLSEYIPSEKAGRFPAFIVSSPEEKTMQLVGFNPNELSVVSEREFANYDPGMCCIYNCRNMVKSEFFENLAAREEEVKMLRASLEETTRKQLAAEISSRELGMKVKDLKEAMAAEEGRFSSLQSQRMMEVEKSEEKLRHQMARCTSLQAELAGEARLRIEAETRLEESEAKARAELADVISKLEESESARCLVEEELERANRATEAKVEEMEDELRLVEGKVTNLEVQYEALEEVAENAKAELERASEERLHLERQLAAALSANASAPRGGDDDLRIVVRELQDALDRQSAELASARTLKQYHANVDLLKEELAEERQKRAAAEAEAAELGAKAERAGELEGEVRAWEEASRKIPGVEGREDLPRVFSQLQREVVSALASQGELRGQLAEREASLTRAEVALTSAQAGLEVASREASDAKATVRSLERKLSLVTLERDGLKAVLESYEAEERDGIAKIQNVPEPQSEETKNRRIQELQSLLAASSAASASQEAALAEANLRASENRRIAERHLADLESCRRQVAACEREAEGLRREVAALESRAGKGDYDRSTTKVVHLALNPESMSRKKSEEDSWQLKVAELQEKVKALEAEANGRVTAGDSGGAHCEALERRVASLEKKEVRLKEIFQEKIVAFREACYCLFGYRVDMVEAMDPNSGSYSTTVLLRSTFAADESEYMKFKQSSPGKYDIVSSTYLSSPELQRMVNTFVARFHCIPALTANLTMELFNQQTSS